MPPFTFSGRSSKPNGKYRNPNWSSSQPIPSSSPPIFSQSSSSQAGPSSTITPNHKRGIQPELLEISSDDDQDDFQVLEVTRPPAAKRRQINAPNGRMVQHGGHIDEEAEDRAQAELVDLTQAENIDEDDPLESYGVVDSKIVGMQYYDGMIAGGEQVIIQREPHNAYDSNAIQVLNVRRHQVGHIPRTMAAKLARHIDNGSIKVEGVLTGNPTIYDCQMQLTIYGSAFPDAKVVLTQALFQSGIRFKRDPAVVEAERRKKELERQRKAAEAERKRREKAAKKKGGAPPPRTAGSSGAADSGISELMGNSSQNAIDLAWEGLEAASTLVNPRELESAAEKFGLDEKQLEQMPLASQPKAIETKLLPYQLQGLAWMLKCEHPQIPQNDEEVVQLWKRNPAKYDSFRNMASGYTCDRKSLEKGESGLMSGGILSDDMGLGKTIQMISLAAADPSVDTTIVPSVRKMDPNARITLVVAPVSVMSNWKQQIEKHMSKEHAMSVYTYHGSERNVDLMKQSNVVITTYGTLAQEYDKKKKAQNSGLFSIKWRRVILDEAHQIRNPKTRASIAAANLEAESRWCLTGTPIINKLQDLYSLVRFLRMSGGLAESELFNRLIVRPITAGDPTGTTLLQALMSNICLRRLKSMKFVDLKIPALTEHVTPVKWTKKERERYNILDAEAKGLFEKYKQAANRADSGNAGNSGVNGTQYRFILECLLRMRQACNHTNLCAEKIDALMAFAKQNEGEKVEMNAENKILLQELLQLAIDSQEDCPICLESLVDPVITTCKHIYDTKCIEKVIEIQHKCPMCRAELPQAEGFLVEPKVPDEEEEVESENENDLSTSSKIESMLHILDVTRKKDPSLKIIVFSQWTKFLDLIEPHLKAHGHGYTRVDGTMNVRKRDAALHRLDQDDDCTVMLASLGVCSVGLNLVAASTVIFMDTWWAPAIEDQAVDRVHRLGQTRPTRVFRLVMEDSIEERVMLVQKKKRELFSSAFREKESSRGKSKQARLADIQTLLG